MCGKNTLERMRIRGYLIEAYKIITERQMPEIVFFLNAFKQPRENTRYTCTCR